MVRGVVPRARHDRPDPDGAGDHDRHRFPRRGRDHEGGLDRARADHRRVDLDHRGDRNPDRGRLLLPRGHRHGDDTHRALGVPLDRAQNAHRVLRQPYGGVSSKCRPARSRAARDGGREGVCRSQHELQRHRRGQDFRIPHGDPLARPRQYPPAFRSWAVERPRTTKARTSRLCPRARCR